MTNFYNKLNTIINLGTNNQNSKYEKWITQTINIICYSAILFIIPFLIFINYIQNDFKEIIVLIVTQTIISLIAIINKIGKTISAAYMLMILTIFVSWLVTLISEVQTAAVFANFLVVIMASQIPRKNLFINIIILIALLSFLYLNYYQITQLKFDLLEYLTVIPLFIIIFLILRYLTFQQWYYQYKIEKKNEELSEKNETIKYQAEKLLSLTKDTHQKEIELKQKDIDTVLANNRMQYKIRKNILDQLEDVKTEKESLKLLKTLKLELKQQIERQEQLNFSEKNLEIINADFYSRLQITHPKLSKKEQELCSYIRLGLSTKEIASLLKTSENTVYVTKNRLKKKLNIDQNNELDSYIKNF